MMLRDLAPLSPATFFNFSFEVPYLKEKRFMRSSFLPSYAGFLGEEHVADLALYWKEKGLSVDLVVHRPLKGATLPHFRRDDSLELFIDTRKTTQTHIITRFCHHFLFLPEEVEGVQFRELTRFRADDSHDYAAADLFSIKTKPSRLKYQMEVEISSLALYGYDTQEIDRIGFAYRVNYASKGAQHMPVSSRFFALEKHPDLWAEARFSR